MYQITDSISYTAGPINAEMFGLNFVLTYDMEFLETGPLLELLGGLQPESLRFPGGSITEIMFEDVEYGETEWAASYLSSVQGGVTQRDYLESFVASASEINADIQIVLPTRIAFEQTTGQAIAASNYGYRTQIDIEYYNLLTDYIDTFLSIANSKDVSISRFEIGNEFWGSGRMTASEYGYLAAEVTEFLALTYPDIDTIAQVSYNAGVFSPVEDTVMYLTENGGDYDVHFSFQDLTGIDGLQEHVMPGQGSGVGQTQSIAEAFNNNPVALEALDGIVDHIYFRRGFEGIDSERNHALINIPRTFKDITGVETIDTYITEWSVRNIAGDRYSNGTNHLGLQYASSTLEAFFELVENDVKGANFWPVTFGNESIDRRVLIDTSDQDYTFGGEVFKLLSDNLIGLSPIFDFEVEGEFDTHGFSDSDNLVFYVSERSGYQNSIVMDYSIFGFDGSMFMDVTYLSEDGTTGEDIDSNPVILGFGGQVLDTNEIELNLSPWSLAQVRVQAITDSADEIAGSKFDDVIRGKGGNDWLLGRSGNDSLIGNLGNDRLEGGRGLDTLKGGWGNDSIFGGDGDDELFGTFGDNLLDGQRGDDLIIGGAGNDVILGGAGNDTISVDGGSNIIIGGDGDDEIFLAVSAELWSSGSSAVNVVSRIQAGTREVIQIDGFQASANVIRGGSGYDILHLSENDDAFFIDDHASAFNSLTQTFVTSDGAAEMARIADIEEINAGNGSDIIDLTSARYSLSEMSIALNGGAGDDTIWGSNADETISGGNGDDVIFGGAGDDVLIGGAGRDIFEFNVSGDNDSISDFNSFEGDVIFLYGSTHDTSKHLYWNGDALTVQVDLDGSQSEFHIDIDFHAEHDVADFTSDTWWNFVTFIE